MIPIDLDRRFVEWKKGDDADPELWARFRRSDGTLGWSDLLKKRRVVVLAEGGSGKSVEFARQSQLQREAGLDAWYLTVQGVAEDGIADSLNGADFASYREWMNSDRPGWFFIDSIDEARLNRVRFEKALQQISHGIAGAEDRTHIVVSGRHTDWEFRRDLARMNDVLPVPQERASPPSVTPDEELVRILRRERAQGTESSSESALVVIMVGLDAPRVRRFAEGCRLPGAEEFIGQIDQANLWDFARRPLDLGWLVDFWRKHRRLGSLAETLQTSLTERLKEPDPQRERLCLLDPTRAMNALERLGAAMVFGRAATASIPDSEIEFDPPESAFKLEDVLPDYSGAERAELLSRPVFDPATFGRTRLHNDNLGVVRSYLAARWLLRLRGANLSTRDLFALLFGESYEVKVIKPSTRETAAWLSIWDADVAREVVRREPWVLLSGGDPGSLSADTRCRVLEELARRMVAGDLTLPPLDADSLKRFTTPELSATVRDLWLAHPDHAELRQLLLRLISFGQLKTCADIPADVAFDELGDRRFQILAGRALVATADEATKRRYAQFILSHLPTLPNALIWEAVEGLFPTYIGVDGLLSITSNTGMTDTDGGLGFEWQGPEFVQRLESKADIEHLLRGLLDQLGGRAGSVGHLPDEREDAYFPTIGASACRLLEYSGQDEAPTLVIEAALRLGQDHRSTSTPWRAVSELPDKLLSTPSRRRQLFWEAAARLGDHPALDGHSLDGPFEMRILGWSPRLSVEDLEWLLADGPKRAADTERRLAINAALEVFKNAGAPESMMSRISNVAMTDPVMQRALEEATKPRKLTPDEQARKAELNAHMRRNDAEQGSRDRSWIDFVAGLRADPRQLRHLRPVSDKGADQRLACLWQLLSSAEHGKNRYAIDSVGSVEHVLGPDLAAALRVALIGFWRNWQPRLASARAPSERNQVRTLDCMGITGVTLEAQADNAWATRLDSTEAKRAAGYATLELNGFPRWLAALAVAHPEQVAAVLTHEVLAEISAGPSDAHYKTLQNLSYADAPVQDLMAPILLEELRRRPDIPEAALGFIIDVLGGHARSSQREDLLSLALERFGSIDIPSVAALYIGVAFAVDSDRAADALSTKLDSLPAGRQTELVELVLPLIFGDRPSISGPDPKTLTFSCLETLVRIAYTTVRISEDRQHRSGRVYSPDQRDRAESARGVAFKQLIDTPGRATYQALLRFADTPGFPIPTERLKSIAIDRAAADSEHDPWPPAEVKAFEDTHETAPRTARDLQRLALQRLADIQHDLLHSDFAQGKTLRKLDGETAVQNWVADRLELKKGRSYSVERESHVAEEKEPDIRLRAKAGDAAVPIEIKVAESWSLADLESALVAQLCGKYLRARNARHGLLLVVHQQPRERGWKVEKLGTYLDFDLLIRRLRNRARRIAAEDPYAPQAEVAVLDVSSIID